MFLRGGNHNETHDLGCGGGRIPVTRTSGVFALPTAAQQEAKRSITELGPNLFRFQNNCHFFDFLVTDEGVVATDPIKAKLSGAVLRDCNMGPLVIDSNRHMVTQIAGADLCGAGLRGNDLAQAGLDSAKLSGARLKSAQIEAASMKDTEMDSPVSK